MIHFNTSLVLSLHQGAIPPLGTAHPHQKKSIAMVQLTSRNIFNRDDVENWNHIPETCEEAADDCGDAAGSRHKAVNLKNSQIVRWQSVLSADPWWMLAHTSCCTRFLVAGRSWSRHRQRAQGRFVDVARVPVAKQLRQKAASISEATCRRRISRRLLRKSNTMHPNWRTLVWVFIFLAKSTVTHFTLSPTM